MDNVKLCPPYIPAFCGNTPDNGIPHIPHFTRIRAEMGASAMSKKRSKSTQQHTGEEEPTVRPDEPCCG
ncbi:MAG: hypothetical protein IJV58_04135 [Oscillospiraceae bacterium]|nr:hypothetical protein [Oscillospiraceae bacterium]